MPSENAIGSASEHPNVQSRRKLTRSPHGMIAGVCAGISDCFGINLIFVRIVFVSLALLQGIGVLLYLILIVVIPARSSDAETLDLAPACPPQSPRRTIFAYVTGAIGICTSIVAFANNARDLYKEVVELVGYETPYSPPQAYNPTPAYSDNFRRSSVPERAVPQPDAFGLRGYGTVSWIAQGTFHIAQINLFGTTGSASVQSAAGSYRQKIDVTAITSQEVQLVGSDVQPVGTATPDIFHLHKDKNGTLTVLKVCDGSTFACFPVVGVEGNIQVEYR